MPHTDPNMILSFTLLFIIASFTAYYAHRKGRNALLWFIIGVLLGVFAPLILLFFPTVTNDQSKEGVLAKTISPSDPSFQELSESQQTSDALKQQEEENKLWYYLDQNHQQIGPVSVIALRELWKRGLLELNNYVWSDGMAQWEKVDNLPELKAILNKP
jgi:hypothetical protein